MKKPNLLKRKSKTPAVAPSRITNETVAEHRERILAGGRKFKYPRQYARHKLVFNAIIIIVVTLIVMSLVAWQQLYLAQNTGTFFYRVTRIVPTPVANVDGALVRYSDYLMSLSGSQHYLQQSERVNLDSEDGKRQIEFIKRQALDGAIADSYAAKLAPEVYVTVSDKEVSDVIDSSLNTVSGRISQDVYDDSTQSTLGYSADEYRHIIYRSLVRQKVAYAVDKKADDTKKAAEAMLAQNVPITDLVKQLQDKGYDIQVGSSGLVPKTNHDGGLTQEANKLQKNALSKFFKSTTGDGYYVVQLTESNDQQVAYNFIRIPLSEFSNRLKSLKNNNKIQEYINVSSNNEAIRR